MTHASASPVPSSMTLLRGIMRSIDDGIEDAIDAHGFSLSALTADDKGALLHFCTADGLWHLTFTLPPDGRSQVTLRRGAAESPSVALTVAVSDGVCRDLSSALGIAMELFTTIGQS